MAPSQLTKPLQPAKLTARNQLMPARRRRALKQVMPARPTAAQMAAPSQLTALTRPTASSQLTAPPQPTPPNQPPPRQAPALQLPQQRRRRWCKPTKRRRFRRGISVCILLSCQAIILARLAPGYGVTGSKRRPTIGRLGRCASRKTRRRLMATTWMCR